MNTTFDDNEEHIPTHSYDIDPKELGEDSLQHYLDNLFNSDEDDSND